VPSLWVNISRKLTFGDLAKSHLTFGQNHQTPTSTGSTRYYRWYALQTRHQVNPGLTRDGHVWSQRLEPHYDELLSNFAFRFNLRRYTSETHSTLRFALRAKCVTNNATVERFRLTLG